MSSFAGVARRRKQKTGAQKDETEVKEGEKKAEQKRQSQMGCRFVLDDDVCNTHTVQRTERQF